MQALAVANPDLYINLADMIQGTKTTGAGRPGHAGPVRAAREGAGSDGLLAALDRAGAADSARRRHRSTERQPDDAQLTRAGPRAPLRRPHGAATPRPRRRQDHPAWFLVPALVVLVVFFFVPTLFNFVYAFTDWSSFTARIDFVGFDNFVSLFTNGSLLADLRITLIYAVLVAIFQNLFGLILALLLERDTRINRFARVAFFVPVVMSALAVGYIFQALLKPEGGLNEILGFVTGQHVTIAWLGRHDLDDRRRRPHPRLEVDGAVDAHLPRRAQDHQRGRPRGGPPRRRVLVAAPSAASGSRCSRRR